MAKSPTKRTQSKSAGGKRSATKKSTPKKSDAMDDDAEVAIDRRDRSDRRRSGDRRTKSEPVEVERRTVARREKVNRRRQIDPTTCERDYTVEEIEFMSALDDYKRTSGRMFPTCSEILEVIRDLGYQKIQQTETAAASTSDVNNALRQIGA